MAKTRQAKLGLWYWADDSGKGSQNKWVKYNDQMSKQLEAEWKKKKSWKKKVKVDDERYVDLADKDDMWQRRYDDSNKMRKVKRDDPKSDDESSSDESSSSSSVAPQPPPKKSKSKSPAKSPSKSPVKPATSPGTTKWYWADDGPKGSQTKWVLYSTALTQKLEKAFNNNRAIVKVDDQRYVDLSNKSELWQCRGDDPTKRRKVRRGKPDDESDSDDDDDDDKDSDDAKSASNASDDDDSSDDSDDSDSSDSDQAKWFWAGDSKNGSQDVWIQYDDKLVKRFEKAFKKGKEKVDVDDERYIDLKNMLQRRKDDPNKRRTIKRFVPKKKKAPATTSGPATKKRKTTKATTTSTSTTTTPPPTTSTTSTPATTPTPDSDDDDVGSSISATMSVYAKLDAPDYWTDYDSMSYFEVNVKPNTEEFKMIAEGVMEKTIASYHKNNSMNHKVLFNKLEVTKLVRIQNPSTWLRYNARRKLFSQIQAPAVQHILTPKPKDAILNEAWLLHGLNSKFLDEITIFGFDPRHCSLNGMFGAGLYFAENSSKSNQYCHANPCTLSGAVALANQSQCKCTQSTEVCLILCRVLLGDALVEKKFQGNGPGQFWHGRRTEPPKPDGKSFYNSVVGESQQNYSGAQLQLREYIVYESSQVYPEYKVYYKRKK